MSSKRTVPLALVSLLMIFAVGASPSARAGQQAGLFSSPSLRIAADRAAVLQPSSTDPRYRRSRLALLDTPLLVSSRLQASVTFNLFDDVTLEIVFDEIISHGRQGHSFLGRVAGQSVSSVLFEQIDEVVVGAIHIPGAQYVVRFAGNGLHSIHEVRFDTSAPVDDFINVQSGEAAPAALDLNRAGKKKKFNYLGVYTQAALNAQGGKKGIKATARATVTKLNAGLKAQKVKHVVKFKGVKKVKGADDGNLTNALNGVTNQNDGVYDETGKFRNQKAADFVGIYIVGDGTGFGFCGLGWRPFTYNPTNERFGYHSVREDCNARGGGNTGAHEALHNMGGCHPNVAGDGCFNGTTPNGGSDHAFVSFAANFTTLLGTGAVCATCVRLATVSGPRRFQGAKVTDANSKINVLVNNGAATYAGYR